MSKLSQDGFLKAKDFLKRKARKLDLAWFEYWFENGSAEDVLRELAKFQNEDGGFGQGIEPDIRLKTSSPIATTIGFQYLRELHIPSENEMVQKGIKYFLNTYDSSQQGWHAVPKEVNDEPHVPWWHVQEVDGASVKKGWGNPDAEIIGYLLQYSELVPPALLESLREIAMKHTQSLPVKMEMHEMLCFIRLSQCLPQDEASIVIQKLRDSIREVIALSPEEWDNYGAKPLMIVHTKKSPLADLIRDEIELNLDYEIKNQEEDGCWSPNWAWGQYEEAWRTAKKDWQGYLTVETLRKLKDFGRLKS